MKKFLIFLSFIILHALSYGQINFMTGSVADVMDEAKKQNKVVMVDVLTEWCKWCIELDNKVYANPEVAAFANEHQINYKIDAEKGEGKDFAKKYNVRAYPTILFINPDETELDRIVGYVPVKDFLETITDYNKGINTLNYLVQLTEKEPSNTEALYKLSMKYMTLGDIENAKINLNKVLTIDPENKSGKTDDAKLQLASVSSKETITDELDKFINDYPESDVLKDAYISLAENLYYSKEDAEKADMMFRKTLELYPNDEWVMSSYGQFKNAAAGQIADKGKSETDYRKGLQLIDEALPLVKGSVNEASSYYIQSKLYYNLKEYDQAMASVDKALKIFDRKLYRDHKEKIPKQN